MPSRDLIPHHGRSKGAFTDTSRRLFAGCFCWIVPLVHSNQVPEPWVRGSVLKPPDSRRQLPTSFLWDQQGVDLTDGRLDGAAGAAVAISANGMRVAVGAPGDFGSQDDNLSGWVRVYDWNAGRQQWEPLGAVPLVLTTNAQGRDRWGKAIALSADGSILAIAASFPRTQRGLVRLHRYDTTTSTWMPLGRDILLGNESQLQGITLDLSANGRVVIIGDAQDEGNSLLLNTQGGRVRVYSLTINNNDFSTATWSQLGNNLDGDARFSNAGRVVAISADGTVVAVAGQNRPLFVTLVRVYKYSNGQFVQRGTDIEGLARTRVFEALALSADGSIVAVGDPNSSLNVDGDNGGRVRVFGYDASTDVRNQRGQALVGEEEGENFGCAIDMSVDGSVLVVGSPLADNPALEVSLSSQVRVYRLEDNRWHLISQVLEGDTRFGRLGQALALASDDGSVMVLGEPSPRSIGAAHVFAQTNWTPAPTLSPQPTPVPTVQPTFPRPAPQPFFCFSGESTVQVKHVNGRRYTKILKDLKVGDHILVAKDRYEPVYSFGHKLPAVHHSDFLKITVIGPTQNEVRQITLTPDHRIFVGSESRAIPASLIRVGYHVHVIDDFHDKSFGLVIGITAVAAKGLIAPFTPSGTLVVNGIHVSAFTSIQGSEKIQIRGFSTGLTHHWLGCTLVLPLCIWCHDWELCNQHDEIYIDGIPKGMHHLLELYM